MKTSQKKFVKRYTIEDLHDEGRWAYKKGIEDERARILEVIQKLLIQFANTHLDKRGTGWDWILKVRDAVGK